MHNLIKAKDLKENGYWTRKYCKGGWSIVQIEKDSLGQFFYLDKYANTVEPEALFVGPIPEPDGEGVFNGRKE